ncbi:MAG: PepSY-associated TM helix domain-containing protein [Egibacteraceae bacterium]
MAKVYDKPASVEGAAEELQPPEEDLNGKSAPAAMSGMYRAAWRWHFYAGLFVIPFLVTLAVTGAIYLFKDQAEPIMYRDLTRVPLPVEGTATRPLGEQVSAVQDAFPNDSVASVVQPLGPTRSTQVFINPKEGWDQPADSWAGGKRVVYVNPYNAEVLGHQVPDDLFMENIREVHNGLMAGTAGNRLVEIVASWTVILTMSGFYLWWRGREPRRVQQARGALNARSALRRRHAQVGALGGTLVLFFVISGLFWSGFWGTGSQKVAERIQGYPEYSEEATTSTPVLTKDLAGGDIPVPWAAERLPVPASGAGHHGKGNPSSSEAAEPAGAAPIGIDQAAAIAEARLSPAKPSLWLNMPEGDKGVYTIKPNGHGTESYTTLHIDQYSGKVLADYGYDDFGVVAKTISEGVNLHQSSRFGGWADAANTGVNLLMCSAVVFLAVTGPMMWWKRRPKGAFSPPRRSSDPRTRRRLFLAVMLPIGILFPLGGITMLAVLLLDWQVFRRIPRLARAFGSA